MYLAVLVFNTVTISKCSLIDLLSAGKKTEQVKMKKPAACIALFLFSAAILGVLYYLVSVVPNKLDTRSCGIVIALGCLATFLFFWSLSGFLLQMMKRNRKYYLKDLNAFVLRQINSKVNTTVFAMTIICIMLYDHHGPLQRSGNESFFQRVFKRNDTGGCEHGIPAAGRGKCRDFCFR